MARTTDSFFALVEESFDVETITPEKIMEKFYSGTFGDVEGGWYKSGKKRKQKSQATTEGQSVFRGLAERLSEGREIYEDIGTESKKEFPDFDNLRRLKNNAQTLDIYSKEVTKKAEEAMDLVSIKLREKRKEVVELKEREESISKDLDKIDDLTDLDNVKRRIKSLSKKVDVSDLESRIEEIRIGLEAQREAEKEEKIRIQQEQQAEAKRVRDEQLKKIEEIGEGEHPDF